MEFIDDGALRGASRFCFGCEQLGGVDWGDVDIAELNLAIRLALSQGINFFDTAAVYGLGLSESRLSDALGDERFDVKIATKGGLTFESLPTSRRALVSRDSSGEALDVSVTGSLERLGTDSLPVFYLHWPDSDTPIESTMKALMSLKKAGKIENVGLSNFDCEQIRAAQRFGDVDVVQVSFSLLSKNGRKVVDMCASQGIPVCAYGVLAQGLLTGKYSFGSVFSASDRRNRLDQFSSENLNENLLVVNRISELARRLGKKPAQIAIRYVLQYSGISSVVVGIKTRLQLIECTDVFGWELSQQDIDFLEN